MKAEALLELYDRVAEAPDAIVRLRRFVLDLAVRGKLVEQDARDEPASELIKRSLATERRTRGIKNGGPALAHSNLQELLFEIPSSWSWASLGEIFEYDAGKKVEPDDLNPERWLVELEDIEKETGRLLCRARVSERESKSTKSEFLVGDILYGKLRPYLTKVLVADEPGYSTTEIVAIRPLVPMSANYCALALRRPDFVSYVTRLGQGTKMPRLRTEDAIVAPFPVPPVVEQHRIVAKVDELMALLDRLEDARGTREATRDRLTTATFGRLTAADTDAQTLPTHARFALDALPALTTRADQIKQLRQTILNLAVRGKLVAQIPSEESGRDLLAKIQSRRVAIAKAAGVRLKTIKKFQSGLTVHNFPESWVVESFGSLVDPTRTISYGVLVPGQDVEGGVPLVRAQDLAISGQPARPSRSIAPEVEAPFARTRLMGGEILLCVVGSIGKIGVAPEAWAGANIARAVARIAPSNGLHRDYLLVAMRSDLMQAAFADATRTLAQPTLNVGLIEALQIPIPPLAEQHRIVAKVDELMVLCDRLEAALQSADRTRGRLLEALLHLALASGTTDRKAA